MATETLALHMRRSVAYPRAETYPRRRLDGVAELTHDGDIEAFLESQRAAMMAHTVRPFDLLCNTSLRSRLTHASWDATWQHVFERDFPMEASEYDDVQRATLDYIRCNFAATHVRASFCQMYEYLSRRCLAVAEDFNDIAVDGTSIQSDTRAFVRSPVVRNFIVAPRGSNRLYVANEDAKTIRSSDQFFVYGVAVPRTVYNPEEPADRDAPLQIAATFKPQHLSHLDESTDYGREGHRLLRMPGGADVFLTFDPLAPAPNNFAQRRIGFALNALQQSDGFYDTNPGVPPSPPPAPPAGFIEAPRVAPNLFERFHAESHCAFVTPHHAIYIRSTTFGGFNRYTLFFLKLLDNTWMCERRVTFGFERYATSDSLAPYECMRLVAVMPRSTELDDVDTPSLHDAIVHSRVYVLLFERLCMIDHGDADDEDSLDEQNQPASSSFERGFIPPARSISMAPLATYYLSQAFSHSFSSASFMVDQDERDEIQRSGVTSDEAIYESLHMVIVHATALGDRARVDPAHFGEAPTRPHTMLLVLSRYVGSDLRTSVVLLTMSAIDGSIAHVQEIAFRPSSTLVRHNITLSSPFKNRFVVAWHRHGEATETTHRVSTLFRTTLEFEYNASQQRYVRARAWSQRKYISRDEMIEAQFTTLKIDERFAPCAMDVCVAENRIVNVERLVQDTAGEYEHFGVLLSAS